MPLDEHGCPYQSPNDKNRHQHRNNAAPPAPIMIAIASGSCAVACYFTSSGCSGLNLSRRRVTSQVGVIGQVKFGWIDIQPVRIQFRR